MSAKDKDKKLDSVNHIALSVTDVRDTAQWYKERFNCKIDYLDDTWAYLQFENISLALVVAQQHPPHIAFEMENAEQYGTLKPHRDGTRSLYVKDPAGNSVELIDKQSIKPKSNSASK